MDIEQAAEFKYNTCYCSIPHTSCILRPSPSFKYNTCYCSTVSRSFRYFPPIHSNTTLVNVQRSRTWRQPGRMQIQIQHLLMFNSHVKHHIPTTHDSNTTLVNVQRNLSAGTFKFPVIQIQHLLMFNLHTADNARGSLHIQIQHLLMFNPRK